MRPQNIALVVIAGGVSLSAVGDKPVIAEQPVAMPDIDFTALHRQTSGALNLHRSQQLRALTIPAPF